jgi:two-component sensor histidine kinase
MADITLRKQAEDRDRLLSLEVNHRAKNLLAVVQSVAIQTGRLYGNPDFVTVFNQRIRSLAASHDLLVNSQWQGVELTALVNAQLELFADLVGIRILVNGPPLLLKAEAAQAIGLALHELVTNASKYGALSTSEGKIDVGWSIVEKPDGKRFLMHWQESNGPPICVPQRVGFGHSVLVGMAEYALAGRVTLAYPANGLKWELDAPAEFVRAAAAVASESTTLV